jgi:hypothetical protein
MNLYEPHMLQIDSGTMWRCDHGKTGFKAGFVWAGCFWCAIKHPIVYARWKRWPKKMKNVWKRFVLKITTLLLLILLPSCETVQQERANTERESYGVVVRGYLSKGSIINNNDFTVQIQAVWVFQGESTIFVRYLKPHGAIFMENISHQHSFYIRDSTGVRLLGFVGGDPFHEE